MSRIGKLPVLISDGVKVDFADRILRLKGPKGELMQTIPFFLDVEVDAGEIRIKKTGETKEIKQVYGTIRSKCANMMIGVSEGFERALNIVGVGYRAQLKGKELHFSLGRSHPVVMDVPEGIEIKMEGATKILVKGADKELVGYMAAKIRDLRPPDVYKGKGIKYADEVIHKKIGKAAG